ncbi:MAG: cofactor-independent phosphoglycerate mutase [Fibrobacterota bacterium]
MKNIIAVGDGMADWKIPQLGGKTILEAADTPNMDRLSREGILGTVRTVPEGMEPGSDVANLSIMGYNPKKFYTGRGPLEALSLGVELGENDIAYRMNLVTIEENLMKDYSAGHISTEDSGPLVRDLANEMNDDRFSVYPGTGYRHLLVDSSGKNSLKCTPPHDISGRSIAEYTPKGEANMDILEFMGKAHTFLENHPFNEKRVSSGRNPASHIWPWGQGTRPSMPKFREYYGLDGGVISAVDLLKGIASGAGLEVIDVPGATGFLDTAFEAKAEYAVRFLEDNDFIYIHVEAPDETGHLGDYKKKTEAVESFDKRMLGTFLKLMEGKDYRIMILPDHYTPVEIKTHSAEPVPFLIYSTRGGGGSNKKYTEKNCGESGLHFEDGPSALEYFLKF